MAGRYDGIDVSVVAKVFGMSDRAVRLRIARGQIPATRVGNRGFWKVDPRWVIDEKQRLDDERAANFDLAERFGCCNLCGCTCRSRRFQRHSR